MRHLRVLAMAAAVAFLGWAAWRAAVPAPSPEPGAPPASSTAPEAVADHRTITEDTALARVRIRYPVLGVLPADAELDRAIEAIIADFRANQVDPSKLPGEPKPTWQNELRIEYVTSRFSRRIETVRLYVLVFTGGAHPNNFSVTKTFDLGSGKELHLADIFLSDVDYLMKLSEISRDDLLATTPYPQEEMIREGTQPRSDNFRNFMLDEQGMRLIFDPYQVAPYAAGTQEVYVYWTMLKDIVRPEFRPEFD